MTLSMLSGAVAAALSGVFSLAQVFHIVRKRSTAGLSDTAWLLLGLTFAAWLAWGLLQSDPYLIATNTASLAGSLWVLWRIHADFGIQTVRVAATAAAVGAAFLTQLLGGTAGALLAVLTITGFIRARQQRTARAAADLSGVAMSPWVISSVAQVVWWVHGLSADKVVLVVHAPFAIAANGALLLTVRRRRHELAATKSTGSDATLPASHP
jgi:uncharacterized protein with PQ loop repeat